MEDWREIPSFPGYSVSNHGRVRRDESGRCLALLRNQGGVINVGLMRDGVQHKRGVALLVARAFLEPPEFEAFDTPINLDGDRSNNLFWNLVWRPRWFAVKYFHQFQNIPRSLAQPLEDIATGQLFKTSWLATIGNGLLHRDLVLATLGYQPVWPTYQRFRLVYPDIE